MGKIDSVIVIQQVHIRQLLLIIVFNLLFHFFRNLVADDVSPLLDLSEGLLLLQVQLDDLLLRRQLLLVNAA